MNALQKTSVTPLQKETGSSAPAFHLAQAFAEHVEGWAKPYPANKPILTILRDLAYMTSMAASDGDTCIYLDDLEAPYDHLDKKKLAKQLLDSHLVGTPAVPGHFPFILDTEHRLYLHRYFDYESRLAQRLMASKVRQFPIQFHTIEQLNKLFGMASPDSPVNWQKVAAALALRKNLTIISGGPGTGKTATIANLLACILTEEPENRMALAAPTGKAAARMLDAIRQRAQHLEPHLQALLPQEAYTLHRLLGVTASPGVFRHHAAHPLALDTLVVDEASMLDLGMATRLFEALPGHAKIILLGDKDQLAAVEAGAVFSDLSADPTLSPECIADLSRWTGINADKIHSPEPVQKTALQDHVIWFSQNFRFAENSGISQLAKAIREGDKAEVIQCLSKENESTLVWIDDGETTPQSGTVKCMIEAYAPYFECLLQDIQDKKAIFDTFDHFRILCAVQEGARGVKAINQLITQHYRRTLAERLDKEARSEWYMGRPVMVLQNDYILNLFNGDIGITLPDESGELMVYFQDSQGEFNAFSPLRLPEHENAFAMTVHKSQGSEFNSLLLLLPAQVNRVLSRELIYTAVTRAREKVILASSLTVLEQGINAPTKRRSGLLKRLSDLERV